MARHVRPAHVLLAILVLLSAAACSQSPAASGANASTAGPGGTLVSGATVGPGAASTQPQASAPVTGTSKPACDLLTDTDLAQITGYFVKSKEGGRADVGYVNNCVWLFEGNAWTLVLGLQVGGAASAYDRSFEYEGGTPVEGLADRAFMGEDSDSLFALVGDTLINLQLVAVGEADGVEQRLVERVLVNLAAST